MSTGGSGPFFQNSFYVGNTFNAILYGVELVLYFQTMQALWRGPKRRRSDKFFMFFSTMLLFCITVYVATQSIIAQEMWVVHPNWPGGAAGYFDEYISAWYETFGSSASILLQLMSDGLLIYRCWTVWCGNWRVIMFPALLWLASFVFGILELYASGSPNANFFAGFAAHIGVAYFSLTIGLNVITTSIICARIISYGRKMNKELGAEFSATYFTAVSIIVESALPYTLFGIAFLVAFGLESEFSVLLLSIYGMFTCVSPQMLILRVAEGRAWTRETGTHQATALAFPAHNTSEFGATNFTSPSDIENGSAIHLGGLSSSEQLGKSVKMEA